MKNFITRESYKNLVANRSTNLVTRIEGDVDITTYTDTNGRPCALVFVGKSNKPSIYSAYLSEAIRDGDVEGLIKGRKLHKERVAARRAERNAPHTLKVGDILYSSWGYDQTNISFYQVVDVVGKNSVKIRAIAKKIDHSEFTADFVVAVPNVFLDGEWNVPQLKRVTGTNSINISSYEYATPWDGKPKYQTAFGFGH